MANEIIPIVVQPGTIAQDDLHGVYKVPAGYGGMTVISAQVFPGAAGTLDVALINYGTSGTVAGGTVAGISGGSAALTADTPQALTVTAANQFLDESEWLVLIPRSGALPANSSIVINCTLGITTQG